MPSTAGKACQHGSLPRCRLPSDSCPCFQTLGYCTAVHAAQAEAIAQELREAYARLPPLPPDPEVAQWEVPPPAEPDAAQAAAEAADEDAAAAEAGGGDTAEWRGKEAAADGSSSGRQTAAAEAPGESGPPSQADRPRAPSVPHTEL